ncbi:MAG TPA: hypothetical protein VLY03_13255 [Bacteroidota bacterium]|nr:hypothetical protein [Bacteroidota bacterium]
MHIGIFPADVACTNDLNFLLSLLQSQQAQASGVKISLLQNVGELGNFHGDCAHILVSGEPPSGTDACLQKLKVPYLCSISATVPELFFQDRWARACIPRREFGEYRRILARARTILAHSPAAASLLAGHFGIPNTAFEVSCIPLIDGVKQESRPAFRRQDGRGPFILSYAGDYSSYSNIHRLLQAIERINIPAVIVGRRSNSAYSLKCRTRALSISHLQIVDEDDENGETLQSALSSCEVFVDPTAHGVWNALVAKALLQGKRSVVSSKARLESWFGHCAEYCEPTSPELLHHGITTALNKGSLPTDVISRQMHHSPMQTLEHLVSTYTRVTNPIGR